MLLVQLLQRHVVHGVHVRREDIFYELGRESYRLYLRYR